MVASDLRVNPLRIAVPKGDRHLAKGRGGLIIRGEPTPTNRQWSSCVATSGEYPLGREPSRTSSRGTRCSVHPFGHGSGIVERTERHDYAERLKTGSRSLDDGAPPLSSVQFARRISSAISSSPTGVSRTMGVISGMSSATCRYAHAAV